MLSRLAAARAGGLYVAFAKEAQPRLMLSVCSTRNASDAASSPPATTPPPKSSQPSSEGGDIQQCIANWDAANKVYFGPERDNVNFPIRRREPYCPPVRLGFIPESFFQAFYNKTGVTGPYVLGAGFLTYVLSKEIWIVEHGFTHFAAFWILFIFAANKWGAGMQKFLTKRTDDFSDRYWNFPKQQAKDDFQKAIEEEEKSIWREAGQKYLFEAKRENVDLQLESAYRQRLSEAYVAVKKRLDYQVDVLSAQRRMQQQHMVQWIVDGVKAGISPQQEKDSLAKCLQDLRALSAKAASA
uniref:ATP synthase subunit b n=1 Tax=Enchytraeus cf. crypticus SL-2017 TaxID=2052677 RepID=A0A286Q4U3_9ANNE|nr:mitochondrial ATP synthase subunit b precursor [Enchytraeus cf. crypticus SL-2017]